MRKIENKSAKHSAHEVRNRANPNKQEGKK